MLDDEPHRLLPGLPWLAGLAWLGRAGSGLAWVWLASLRIWLDFNMISVGFRLLAFIYLDFVWIWL